MITQEVARTFFTSAVFGAILFFAITVGPTIMKVLEGEEAASFLRRLIPRYYFFLVVAAGLGAFSSWEHPIQALGLGFISVSAILVRQQVMPAIFNWREQQMDGDDAAGGKFIRARRWVLGLTAVQLLISAAVLARIAG